MRYPIMDMITLCQKTSEIARNAGKLICSEKHPRIFAKDGRANFVTSMDLASQEYIISQLKELLPEANFFAEESDSNHLLPGYNWIIDPIDGTTNYMMNFKHSCISIGLVLNADAVMGVVYNPYLDELYTAVKGRGAFLNGEPIHALDRPMDNAVVLFGTSAYHREFAEKTFLCARDAFDLCADIRRTGTAALDVCYVACGKCDAYFEMEIQPWDFTAGTVIAKEAGACVHNLLGEDITFDGPSGIIVGSPAHCKTIETIISKYE